MTTSHDIDPAFREGLARELQSTLRRDMRWGRHERRRRRIPIGALLRLAAAFVLALPVGAFGTYAALRHESRQERDLIVARLETMVELQRTRLDVQAVAMRETLALAERDLISERELQRRRDELRYAEIELRRREIDLDETSVSGRDPDDRITAPLVNGTDFVMERLELEREASSAAADAAAARFLHLKRLADAEMVSQQEVAAARQQVIETEQALQRADEMIDARQSFIDGDRSALDAELHVLRLDAESRRSIASARLELVAAEVDRMAKLHDRGLASRGELRRARLHLRETEAELRLAELELRLIAARLDASDGAAD